MKDIHGILTQTEVIPCMPRFTHTGCTKVGYGNTGAQPENRSYEKGEKEC